MARRWLSHIDEPARRNSAFIPRPELREDRSDRRMSISPDSSVLLQPSTDAPALRKRLSMYARKRTSAAWPMPREVDEITRTTSLTPSPSTWSLNGSDASGFRSSLRRTSRIVSSTNLAAQDSLSRWIHGGEKSTDEQQSAQSPKSRRSTLVISAPFNFEHISHTSAHKLPKLKDVGTGVFADEVLAASSPEPQSPESSHGEPRATPEQTPATLNSTDRQSYRVRSSSIASIISNQSRTAPTMVHPALRTDNDVANAELASQAWLAPLIHRSSGVPTVKPLAVVPEELAVVPEEQEPESPIDEELPTSAAQPPEPTEAMTSTASADLPKSTSGTKSDKTSLRISTGPSEATDLRDRKSSVPSLSSATGSWEEDIDYCYSIEAESSCNFEWSSPRINSSSPRDSFIPSATGARLYAEITEKMNESPRTSIARQQLKKSNHNSGSDWSADDIAFRNPRKAPETPVARSSDEWPLSNTPRTPSNYESALNTPSLQASPSSSPSLERPNSSQAWGYALSSRCRQRNQSASFYNDSSVPASPMSASPIPPPSSKLPELPPQSSAVNTWI